MFALIANVRTKLVRTIAFSANFELLTLLFSLFRLTYHLNLFQRDQWFIAVSLGHPLSQQPRGLLSGTSSVLLHSMMRLWKHIGDGALPRQVESSKSIHSFLDVYKEPPICQIPPRLLSGTSSILLDSKMTVWRHIGDGALPRQVES